MADKTKMRFMFFDSYFEAVEEMESPDEKLALYECITRFAFLGELPDANTPRIVRAVFKGIQPNIEESLKRVANGSKGGRPKKADEEPIDIDGDKPSEEQERLRRIREQFAGF